MRKIRASGASLGWSSPQYSNDFVVWAEFQARNRILHPLTVHHNLQEFIKSNTPITEKSINLPWEYIIPTFTTLSAAPVVIGSSLSEHFFRHRNKRNENPLVSVKSKLQRTVKTANLPFEYIATAVSTINLGRGVRASSSRHFFTHNQSEGQIGVVRQICSFNDKNDNQSSLPINKSNYFNTQRKSWSHRFSKVGAFWFFHESDCQKKKFGAVRQANNFKDRNNNQSSFPIHILSYNNFNTQNKFFSHMFSKEGAFSPIRLWKKKFGALREANSFHDRNNNQSSLPIHMSSYFSTQNKFFSHMFSQEGAFFFRSQNLTVEK